MDSLQYSFEAFTARFETMLQVDASIAPCIPPFSSPASPETLPPLARLQEMLAQGKEPLPSLASATKTSPPSFGPQRNTRTVQKLSPAHPAHQGLPRGKTRKDLETRILSISQLPEATQAQRAQKLQLFQECYDRPQFQSLHADTQALCLISLECLQDPKYKQYNTSA